MRLFCSFLLAAAYVAPAWAGEDERHYNDLLSLLRQQQRILSRIEDASSSEAGIPELRACLDALAEMQRRVDEPGLWNYISNTEGAMQPLVNTLKMTALQFQRLLQHRFYGNRELEILLQPQLQPRGAEPPSAGDAGEAPFTSSGERK